MIGTFLRQNLMSQAFRIRVRLLKGEIFVRKIIFHPGTRFFSEIKETKDVVGRN